MKKERLDKILSHHGFGSRKDVKTLVRKGLVQVNGKICLNCETGIDDEADEIFVDGEKVVLRKNVYIMMNKAQNVVTSTKDGIHRTVLDELSDDYKINFLGGNLHPVGRLDVDTEGLLLLTTDGSLTHHLTSPKNHVPKTYFVVLKNPVASSEQQNLVKKFALGFEVVPDGNESAFCCQSANLVWISENSAQLTIHEGKYHQVKRMFKTFENEVIFLKRISVGKLCLDEKLSTGEYRELTEEELSLLLEN